MDCNNYFSITFKGNPSLLSQTFGPVPSVVEATEVCCVVFWYILLRCYPRSLLWLLVTEFYVLPRTCRKLTEHPGRIKASCILVMQFSFSCEDTYRRGWGGPIFHMVVYASNHRDVQAFEIDIYYYSNGRIGAHVTTFQTFQNTWEYEMWNKKSQKLLKLWHSIAICSLLILQNKNEYCFQQVALFINGTIHTVEETLQA